MSVRSDISRERLGIGIASYIFSVEIFFVIDGVVFQKQVDFLYSEISVLRHIRPCLDVVFELDHPRIDIEYHRQ